MSPMPAEFSLSSSPIATNGGAGPMPFLGGGPAAPPSLAVAMPIPIPAITAGLANVDPAGTQDAMGTPDGAVIGDPLVARPNELASMVLGHFSDARAAKMEQEQVWLKCHANYRGKADRPANEKAMGIRSKVTMKITRTKVAAAVARHKDIGFKWSLKPTPEPNILGFSPAQLRTYITELIAGMNDKDLAAQVKSEVDSDALLQQYRDLAKARADKMKTRIQDDLVEMRHDALYDQGILDGALYGTMIFKGPLTKERRPGRWLRKGGVWAFLDAEPNQKLYRPELENISPFDFYPSPGAWVVEKMDYGIVRHVLAQRELVDLQDNPGFDPEAIFAASKDKSGAWTSEAWESEVFAANGQSGAAGIGMPSKFTVLEWWGYIKVEDLRRMGGNISKVKKWSDKDLAWIDVDPDDEDMVIANVWVCGNHVLKAWHTHLKPRRLPFYVVPYERIPKSLWGQGVAWMMEDWQAVINTVYRAMMDNMAISALPIGYFDRSKLRSDDKGEITPGKMFEVKDTDRGTVPPIQFYFPPNNVAHMRMIAQIASANIQESTSLPDILQGQSGPGGHRTAEGLSMLGGWADASTRSVQKNFDQEYTIPVIRALYFWEMQFSPDDGVKGDFDVQALGADSVMASEVITQRLGQWTQAMQQNPETAKRVNWTKVGEVTLREMSIKDEGLMYTEAQVLENEKKAAQAQMEMQAAAAQNPALQPQMSLPDSLVKAMAQIPEESPIMAPLLRKFLEVSNAMTPELDAAIDAVNATNARLYGGKMSDAESVEGDNHAGVVQQNSGQPVPLGNEGPGANPGLPPFVG